MIYTAATTFNDIVDQSIVDLGVGCGMLTCAAGIMGAAYTIGIDIDLDALHQAQENCDTLEVDVDLIHMNVRCLLEGMESRGLMANTVLMNPPFGTKGNKGIDMVFLQAASKIARNAIYSLHKTSTRDYILKKAREWNLEGQVIAELRYNIDASYKFHKKKSVDVQVDFWRFQVIEK
ncbi:hypothetical protein QVD99_003632 [Batrachochytrium dendrobatidis]|nr:hypothetical protein QVD99_003632 [Batrachochytrium dendrobatidis]